MYDCDLMCDCCCMYVYALIYGLFMTFFNFIYVLLIVVVTNIMYVYDLSQITVVYASKYLTIMICTFTMVSGKALNF